MRKSFERVSCPRRQAKSARRLQKADKRNKVFRAIRLIVIVFGFDELQRHKPPPLQAGKGFP
jgi:hypothetical protein